MTTRVVFFLSVTFICLSSLGTPKTEFFGGPFVTEQGVIVLSGAPDGVHPQDISPEKVQIMHIIPLLETYEKNLRQGTLKSAVRNMGGITRYLFSFIDDERFSSAIHEKYAKRLFKEFGDMDASVVLLYYQTGGSLEKLRALYQESTNNAVRAAVEVCFFAAADPLLEGKMHSATNTAPGPLSVNLDYKPRPAKRQSVAARDVFAARDMEGEPRFEGDQLHINYKNNSSHEIVQVKIPRGNIYYMNWCDMNVWRNDGIPVLMHRYCKDERIQLLTLYPGDSYTRKVRIDFSIRRQESLMPALFSDFNKMVVCLADCWVGSNAEESFQVTLQLQPSYYVASSENALNVINHSDWKTILSDPLQLTYTPSQMESETDPNQIKQETWETINRSWTNYTKTAEQFHKNNN